jgi:hypothetical protein
MLLDAGGAESNVAICLAQAEVLVVKDAGTGATSYGPHGRAHVAALEVEVTDPVGAGTRSRPVISTACSAARTSRSGWPVGIALPRRSCASWATSPTARAWRPPPQ